MAENGPNRGLTAAEAQASREWWKGVPCGEQYRIFGPSPEGEYRILTRTFVSARLAKPYIVATDAPVTSMEDARSLIRRWSLGDPR